MPQPKISLVFDAWVSGKPIVDGTTVIVAVYGKQNWRKEIQPALTAAFSKLWGEKVGRRKIVVAGLSSSHSDPEEALKEITDFFNRMQHKKKFIRIHVLGGGQFKIFRQGQ